jgi:hypothetical protein
MPERLSPTMQRALAVLGRATLLHRPREVPGGATTVHALVKRGLVMRDGQWVRLTPAGRELVDR